ncbi:MAG: hypothetical protein EZS28_047349 [Streblomastix strix]|uniref:Uncharacterized protein n=1 Tax=Streblomastix strix TaxID=222440 RepID=A0A5J4TI18_9EUKA|nr:MAG: hypothetical protein EZS28_047349 [Streblomastix strix]
MIKTGRIEIIEEMVKLLQHSWKHSLIGVQIQNRIGYNRQKTIFGNGEIDQNPKFQRTTIQRRLGFRPLDYNGRLKHRTKEGISYLLTWAQKGSQLIKITERKLRMQIFLKWLKTNRSFFQAVCKGDVLGRILREKKNQNKQTLWYLKFLLNM